MVGAAAGLVRMVAMTTAAAAVGIAIRKRRGRGAGDAPPLDWSAVPLVGIDGAPLDPAIFAGRTVLLVNTASRCGFTPQYEGLEALWQAHREAGLVILAVPSNDFAGQEPGANDEIASFCTRKYGVTFPMLAKTSVIGQKAHPLYRWVRRAGGRLAAPAWNFHKILIGRDGTFVKAFPSFISPRSPQLTEAVERALAAPVG
ncbi:glutathione peroxidase [Acuticoccus sp. M5D2P5]|uniref:glutathione peroxidase n=1 Tax=Acuticoccus kalidii TaxID=2910977 RepID=UPI001F3F7740|nr:glutathione peroxidase [Acuticoccus kalidii]MCF3936294.1 glutathione peroxidase [Acuticoccus kalidii]